MFRLIGFAWRHRGAAILAVVSLGAALATFALAVHTSEGKKRFLIKRLSEAGKMPGRLLT